MSNFKKNKRSYQNKIKPLRLGSNMNRRRIGSTKLNWVVDHMILVWTLAPGFYSSGRYLHITMPPTCWQCQRNWIQSHGARYASLGLWTWNAVHSLVNGAEWRHLAPSKTNKWCRVTSCCMQMDSSAPRLVYLAPWLWSEPSAHRVQVQKLGQPYSDNTSKVRTA